MKREALILRLIVNPTDRKIDFLSGTVVEVHDLENDQVEKFMFDRKRAHKGNGSESASIQEKTSGIKNALEILKSAGHAYKERAQLDEWKEEQKRKK